MNHTNTVRPRDSLTYCVRIRSELQVGNSERARQQKHLHAFQRSKRQHEQGLLIARGGGCSRSVVDAFGYTRAIGQSYLCLRLDCNAVEEIQASRPTSGAFWFSKQSITLTPTRTCLCNMGCACASELLRLRVSFVTATAVGGAGWAVTVTVMTV